MFKGTYIIIPLVIDIVDISNYCHLFIEDQFIFEVLFNTYTVLEQKSTGLEIHLLRVYC